MRTKVKEVSHKGSSSVVEWLDDAGNIYRSIFPTTELIQENDQFYVENVEEGQPYGENWEDLYRTKLGPKGVALLLRKHGIWTLEDYASHTAIVTSVLNQAAAENNQQFRQAVLMRMQGRKQ